MGVDYNTCNSCKEVVYSNYTFYFDGTIQTMNELLQKKEVQKYLFEKMALNKKDVLEKVYEFMRCSHCFCNYCVKPDEISTFYKIDDYCNVDELDFEKDDTAITCSYNYILALMKTECNKCKQKKKAKAMKKELDVAINNLKSFRDEMIPFVKKLFLTKLDKRIEETVKKLENILANSIN